MPGTSGAKGKVLWPGKPTLPLNVHSWTCEIAHDVYDVTPFSPTDDANVSVPRGVYGWSGTFECWLDNATAVDTADVIGAYAELTLRVKDGDIMRGDALCGNASITGPVDGPCTMTVNFTGTVDLGFSWTSTTTTTSTSTSTTTAAP